VNMWYEAVEQEHDSTVNVLKAYVHCSPMYQQETTFTTSAGARRPGGAVLDQVHWGREANTETLKAYRRLKLTMTTTFTKLALLRATTFTEDSPFHPI